MYNPSIGLKSQSSPKINYMPDWWMEYIGFGYDQVNDKYKVLVVECMDPNLDEEFGQSLTKIYTFGEDSWRTIQELPRPLTEDLGKYVNGTLNWIENGVVLLMVSNQICLYNLNSGVLDHPFISISNVSDQPVIYRENLISQRWEKSHFGP
ncbi:hypothetical protein P8452_71716 [Trifolium repens]|nr:hypothetical protein P8452_71716 [Trifolium repens]